VLAGSWSSSSSFCSSAHGGEIDDEDEDEHEQEHD
jgi:hypothetical protein